MMRLSILCLAGLLISAIALAQDDPFSKAPFGKPDSGEKADIKGPFGPAIQPKPGSSEKADIVPPFRGIAKPESQHEKAVTLKNLKKRYGDDRHISYISLQSAAGDTASGVVLDRTGDRITVDTTPCVDQGKRLVIFVAPYKESRVDDARCEHKTYPRSQVIQLRGTR